MSSTVKLVARTIGVFGLLWRSKVVFTLVSLHNVQVFRLLLKTSVESNTKELDLFLAGLAVWLSPVQLCKETRLVGVLWHHTLQICC